MLRDIIIKIITNRALDFVKSLAFVRKYYNKEKATRTTVLIKKHTLAT